MMSLYRREVMAYRQGTYHLFWILLLATPINIIYGHTKEEPENSLELSRAFELAEQFEKDFSKENQIYLTTHSPAFYDLLGSNVNRWSIRSNNISDTATSEESFVTQANPISTSEHEDISLGIAALLAGRAKELYEQINSLNAAKNELENKIKKASLAQVMVEGKTDKTILETAFSKLFPE